MPRSSKKTASVFLSPAKMRAIADRLERDVLAQVAELRRLADLAEGVKAIARKPAKQMKRKASKKAAAPKRAKKIARKPARKAGGRGR